MFRKVKEQESGLQNNSKPSIVRARLGKMFNVRAKEGNIGDVIRSTDSKGNLKFSSRSAVYRREPINNE